MPAALPWPMLSRRIGPLERECCPRPWDRGRRLLKSEKRCIGLDSSILQRRVVALNALTVLKQVVLPKFQLHRIEGRKI
jgi:hypothetical protein